MTAIIGIDFSGAKHDRGTWVAQGHLTQDGALEFDGAEMTRRKDVFIPVSYTHLTLPTKRIV